jgi:RNA polymerase subunit RPABC4/transcription elongation factor Spt4
MTQNKQEMQITKPCKICKRITGNSSELCFSCHGKKRNYGGVRK